MRAEAGQYALKALVAHVKGSLAVEVAIVGGGETLASTKVTLTSISDPVRELCVPFRVPPHASDISISLMNEGEDTVALRALEVRAEDWPFELPYQIR